MSSKKEIYYFRGEVYEYSQAKGFTKFPKEGNGGCPSWTEGLIPSREAEDRVKYIQGKVLTLMEAILSDKEQRKATKDIVKQLFSVELAHMSDDATGFKTLTEGDMVQFSGSVDKFYEDNANNPLPEELS